VPLRHHKARGRQLTNRIALVMWRQRPLPHRSLVTSPTSAVNPTSFMPTRSPQDVRGMPMPPRHQAAAGSRQRPLTAPSPVSPTPAGLTAMGPHQTFEECGQLRQSISSEVSHESDSEDDRPSRSGLPSPDSSLEARECEDSVSLLSPPSSQPSPRASLLGSRNGSATSLVRISGAFRSRSRSRNTKTGPGSGSGGSSRHNSHVSVSSASLALGRARARSPIQGIGGPSRFSIELVLGHIPTRAWATASGLQYNESGREPPPPLFFSCSISFCVSRSDLFYQHDLTRVRIFSQVTQQYLC
jgi:hypothetical protein